jgi:hypothetical protein
MAGVAVEVTMQALYYYGPALVNQSYWDSSRKPPGLLPRLQAAAGPHKSGADPHIAGRALDIILFASVNGERDYADRLVDVFLGLKAQMRFIAIIYNGWEWNGSGVKFKRKGDQHTTHIHIEWSSTGVATASFASDLSDALFNEFSGGNIASGDYGVG